MPAKQRPDYRVNGKKVPSVTTILGAVKGNEHLVQWANRLGLEGVNSNDVRDDSAAVGTLVHACIEAMLTGEGDPQDIAAEYHPDLVARARVGWRRWVEWVGEHEFEPLEIELQLAEAIDMRRIVMLGQNVEGSAPIGGTLDMLARVDGKLELCDFKTGNRAYPEALVQMAGYDLLAQVAGVVEGPARQLGAKPAKYPEEVTGYRVIHIPADPHIEPNGIHTASYTPRKNGEPQPLSTYREAFLAAYRQRQYWRLLGVVN